MEYEIVTEQVEYVELGGAKVTKKNLVAHLANYEHLAKYEVLQTGSLTDDIGKMLHQNGIVEPLRKSTGEMGWGSERVGWRDADGNARELYYDLTKPEYTFKVRLGGRLQETCDTRHEAIGEIAILERRNQDARVKMEVDSKRVPA